MSLPLPEIGPMSLADLELVQTWAEAEGWRPGLDDAAAFHAADPGGYLMARIAGAPVASISLVRFGNDVGFLGLYICQPEHRGRGVGLALFQAAIARLAPGITGLDGVPEQQANYSRSGFRFSHRTIRHEGALARLAPDRTRPLEASDLDAALALDRETNGFQRDTFMRSWLAGGPSRHVRVVVRDGALAGVGVLRACVTGWKLGPVIATDRATAEELLEGFAVISGQEPVSIDIPKPNSAALAMARSRGMAPVFETARMWRGPAPVQDLDRVFGVSTLELG